MKAGKEGERVKTAVHKKNELDKKISSILPSPLLPPIILPDLFPIWILF